MSSKPRELAVANAEALEQVSGAQYLYGSLKQVSSMLAAVDDGGNAADGGSRVGALASLQAVPAFAVYKAMREEELKCFRSVCRLLVMHSALPPRDLGVGSSGGEVEARELSKQHRRILEDLREQFGISQERQELELLAANADPLVVAVQRADLKRHRDTFQSGIEADEVPLLSMSTVAALHSGHRAADDGMALVEPSGANGLRSRRLEGAGDAVSAGSGAGKRPPSVSVTSALQTIDRMSREIQSTALKLIYAPPEERPKFRELLLDKKEQLERMHLDWPL